MFKKISFLLVMVSLLSACAKATTTPIPSATPQTGSATEAIFPTIPPTIAPATPVPTAFSEFSAKPAVDTLKVRVGPGFLFQALILVNMTDTVTVLGSAPGHQWTYIKTADGTEGWVFTELLTSDVDLKKVPLREPKDVQTLRGRVVNLGGSPVAGVTFAAAEGEVTGETNNTATSDADGVFYFFLPADLTGTWSVTYAAISDGISGTIDPQTQIVTLPQNGMLTFALK